MEKADRAMDKLRLIIAVFIPIVIAMFSIGLLVKKFNHEIEFTEKELEGIHEVQSFYQHLYLIQRLRGLRQLQIAGHAGLEQTISQLQSDITHKLDSSRRESHASWLNVRAALESLSAEVREIFSIKVTETDSLVVFDRYSQLTLELIVMLKQVADSSNLTLDPELDSHLLKELVVDRMPVIVEHIALMRGLTAYVAQHPSQLSVVTPRLRYLLRALKQERLKLFSRYEAYLQNNVAVSSMKSGFDIILTSIDAYMDYVQSGMAKKFAGSPSLEVFEQGSATIKIAGELVEQANIRLLEKLLARNSELKNVKYKILVGLGLAVLFLIGLVTRFYYSNRKTHAILSEATTALASAQSRNTAIIDTVVDGIISIDADGIVHDFNPSAENIFGYTANEVIGNKINMLMPEPYSVEHDGYMQNYLSTGHKKIIGIGREVEGRRKNGSVFPMDLAVNEMQINGQRFFTGIVRDITDRKRIETLKNEFISTVSHELRTPLTSIRGSLGLVSGGAVGEVPVKVKELLMIAGNNTERLLVLINDILDLQKIESGKMAFKFKIMDIMPFIEKVVNDNKTYATQYDVDYEINQHDEQLQVFGDQDRLNQVLANLLSNAAKFSFPGSKVQISVARHEGNIRVSVTDHGAGIPEDFQHRIFEKFSQSDASDARVKGGTGLGLNISKLIIEKHGGRINYLTQPGVGTTFYFDLPELSSKAMTNEVVTRSRIKDHIPCVLIVEDDQDVAALLRRMLAEAGFDSDIAYTAAEARNLLENNSRHYQVMTLDIILPDEDGLSLLRTIRNDPKTRELPVVIVSVKADEGKIELNGGAVGVVDWLSKPIDQTRLIHAIAQAATPDSLPRVLHVEDDEDIHKIVALMLQGSCELVWTTTVEASRQVLAEENIDLVLLDIELPDGSGLELLEPIEHHVKPPRVIIFSANEVPAEYVDRVNAILTKSRTRNDELLKTIIGFIKR